MRILREVMKEKSESYSLRSIEWNVISLASWELEPDSLTCQSRAEQHALGVSAVCGTGWDRGARGGYSTLRSNVRCCIAPLVLE